jgi:hypothetical protein
MVGDPTVRYFGQQKDVGLDTRHSRQIYQYDVEKGDSFPQFRWGKIDDQDSQTFWIARKKLILDM